VLTEDKREKKEWPNQKPCGVFPGFWGAVEELPEKFLIFDRFLYGATISN